MATMRSWIDHSGEVVWEPAPALIAQLVEAGQPFWLDIENPTDELIDQLVSRRLADVATIFLPISFLAGFWGQNFDVLTGSIEKGWPAFLVLGVGLSVACVLVIVFMLSRRSWK
jgi:Mg2+ and Co2+ transporter CorA